MLFELIFVSLFVLGWLFCGFLPWLAVSVVTRGNAGLQNLPLCLFAAVVAGLAVPFLIDDGWTGLWLSFVAALLVPALLMAIRRLTMTSVRDDRRALASVRPIPATEPSARQHGEAPDTSPSEGRE